MVDPIRVLHVDDDPEFAALTAECLEREDDRLRVDTETRGEDACSRLDRGEVDCLVSDYEMPGMDGLELLERVRERDDHLPFILFTGRGSEEVAGEALSAGATDYLRKSGGTEQFTLLANRVRNAVATARARTRRQRRLDAIETAREGISILDGDGHYLYVNEAYADLYGYDPAEMVGEHWELVYPDEEVSFAREEILPMVERDGEWHGESTGLRADGSTFPEDHTVARTDSDKLVCTVSDLTEQREREAELSVKTRAMDEAPAGITITDPQQEDNPIVYANAKFEELTGYPREEVVGRNCRFLQGPATDPDPVARMRAAVDAGDPVSVELRNYRRDGTEFWNEVRITPLRDDDGDVTNFVGFQQDVTERKQREQELEAIRERMAFALDATDSIIYEIDPETGTETRHGPFERLYGFPEDRAETTAEFFERGVHPADRDRLDHARRLDELADSDTFEVEYRTHPDHGDVRWLRTRAYVHPEDGDGGGDGDSRRLVGLATDVTEQKRRERELERTNERLEEFAGIVSHDLRNPLNVLAGSLELAENTGRGDHFERCRRAIDRMERLIADLLALAREGQTISEPEPVAVGDVVDECWRMTDTGEATLDVETDRVVLADERRLRQVFENLVRNAVDHARPDVTVTVGGLADGFYVADDGPGIPEADRERVFESGYSTDSGGTGYGLAIVEEIADAHGWDVAVTESENGGARFEFRGVEREP